MSVRIASLISINVFATCDVCGSTTVVKWEYDPKFKSPTINQKLGEVGWEHNHELHLDYCPTCRKELGHDSPVQELRSLQSAEADAA